MKAPNAHSVLPTGTASLDVQAWPMLIDPRGRWYARPKARIRLMVSPADETPMHAHDVQPDELDIALGIDRMQQALDLPVRRVARAWAGLRSFVPDGSLAIGWDAKAEGFFWCVGQGGYGIQTSPAAGRLVADPVLDRDAGVAVPSRPASIPAATPSRTVCGPIFASARPSPDVSCRQGFVGRGFSSRSLRFGAD